MTSLMTSPGNKIGQISKLLYLRQYLSYSVDQILKMSEMLMAIFLVYSTSSTTSGKKKFVASSKWRPFWKFWNIKHSFNLTSHMIRSSQIMPKKFLLWWRHRWRHRMASKFLSIFMFRKGWLREQIARQCLVNKCQYHNCLSRLCMPKNDLNEKHFSRLQVNGQHHRLTGALGTNKQYCKLSQIQSFLRLWRHRKCHVATFRFLLKTHCRHRGWWYHVPHSSFTLCVCLFVTMFVRTI